MCDKCCGTCKHHSKDDGNDDWVCVNPESEYFADYTDYNHSCEEYEEREE